MDTRNPTDLLDGQSPRHGYQGDRETPAPGPRVPAALTIAVSREAGARGSTIARRVGRRLGWQVYSQELLEYLILDGTRQETLADGLPPAAGRWVAEQLGSHEAAGRLADPAIRSLARLSLLLAAQGTVVLIGRGAGFLLPRATTLHVRFVAPLDDRVAFLAQSLRLTAGEARQRVQLRDSKRAEYLRTQFGLEPGNLHDFDLVLNTSSLGEDLSTELVVSAALAKAAQLFPTAEGVSESC